MNYIEWAGRLPARARRGGGTRVGLGVGLGVGHRVVAVNKKLIMLPSSTY